VRSDPPTPFTDTTVAEFGKRFFRNVVAKDRRDRTIPRRDVDASIVPADGSKAVRDVGDLRRVTHAERKFGTLRSLRQCSADRMRQSQRRILCANRVVTTRRSQ
jgi:hypothetical protein